MYIAYKMYVGNMVGYDCGYDDANTYFTMGYFSNRLEQRGKSSKKKSYILFISLFIVNNSMMCL